MSDFWHTLASDWDVALLWALGLVSLPLATRGLCSLWRARRRTDLWFGEHGAAYTLGVVAVLPFYVLLIGVVLECTMLMIVKFGTLNAAFAAARAASVWLPAEIPLEQRLAMIHLAAGQAMAPFASSAEKHLEGVPEAWTSKPADNDAFHEAMNARSIVPLPSGYLQRKRRYALAASQVELEVDEWARVKRMAAPGERVVLTYQGAQPQPGPRAAHSQIRVTLRYEKPIDLPGVGRILGSRAPWNGTAFFTREIESTVTLQKEGPKSTQQTLGIRYPSLGY